MPKRKLPGAFKKGTGKTLSASKPVSRAKGAMSARGTTKPGAPVDRGSKKPRKIGTGTGRPRKKGGRY
jgi:hypothetical protein